MLDGQPTFYDQHGVEVPRTPPRPSVGHAWQQIRGDNDPLAITPQTGQCDWDGRPIHYDLVLGDLHYFATRAAPS